VGTKSTVSIISCKDFNDILRHIFGLDDNDCDIVIDPFRYMWGTKNDFPKVVKSLPIGHRYFFTIDCTDSTDIKRYNNGILENYSKSFLLPEDSISIFNTYKNRNGISIYNYNSNMDFSLGDIAQIIRDKKISEVLSEQEQTKNIG
jgi:hypothetical protein